MNAAPTSQKLRGGYSTPGPIAHFLARRAGQTPQAGSSMRACGDGSLLHGVEIDPGEALRAQQAGLHPTRLAMVIPAELFQGNYAAETRQFFSQTYAGITIVTFKRLVLAGLQQEVVLLLCARDSQQRGIRSVEPEDAGKLAALLALSTSDAQTFKPLDYCTEKWTRYFLESAHAGVTVSGQAPTYVLKAPGMPSASLPAAQATSVAEGEQAGYHQGYTCRVRTPWYVVPSVWNPDAFLLRQIHRHPKLILKRAQATCTSTLHRVRFCGPQDGGHVVAAFLNVLTFAFAEVTGRGYGGGVLTFEPGEAERLPLPLSGAHALDLAECDRLLRTDGVEAVLARTDDVLLKHGLGLADREVRMLHTIWAKWRDRRILRRQRGGKR